jgi:glycosyltransferase involved in cell wall biosynthesis
MIRVLHVIDHLGLGGAQTALLDMLHHRDRERFHGEVAVVHGRGPFADALEADGVTVHSLAPRKWPPVFVPNFLRLLAGGRYDVLHFHLQASNWLLKPLAAQAGAPVRFSHDHTSGDLAFRGIGSLLPDSISHRFSTRVVAVSDGVRNFLCHWAVVPGDLVEVIPNGVDDTTFRPATTAERRAARDALGVPAEGLVVGGMGRLAYEKNFALLAELAPRHPEAIFLVAGTGPEAGCLSTRMALAGVSDRVRFLGQVTDRPRFYQALDVFILPSLHEGLPMAVLEAMAAGVPVLASRLEGIAAALADGSEGLLAEPGDVGAFSAALDRLVTNPSGRAKMAEAARRKVGERFSARWTMNRIETLYESALAG